jgi:hypothetical protein
VAELDTITIPAHDVLVTGSGDRDEGVTVMDRDKVLTMLGEAEAELTTAESVVTHLGQVVAGLTGLLNASPMSVPVMSPNSSRGAGAATAVPDLAPAVIRDGVAVSFPRPGEAVLRVLRERPNYPMTFRQIFERIEELGLYNPALSAGRNAYSTAARRLTEAAASGVVRAEDSRYLYRTGHTASDSAPPNFLSVGNGQAGSIEAEVSTP